MYRLQLLQVDVAFAQHVGDCDFLGDDGILASLEGGACLLVHVGEDTVLVVVHHVDHGAIEDGLVAEHGVFCLLLLLPLFRDVAAGTDDDRGASALLTAQHGQCDGELAVLAAFTFVLGSHFECHALLFLAHQLVDGLREPFEVLSAVALRELQDGVVALGLAFLVHPGEGLRRDVVGPEAHVTGVEHERQSGVLLLQVFRYSLLLYAIEQIVEQRDDGQHGQCHCQFPYPRGDACLCALGVEPLVLDGL